jgi:hypothetical protein
MHLASGRDLGHLTYCTNIHAGEPLDEVMAGLAKHLPAIKAAVAPDRPLGVGLRLGHQAAEGLRDPAALAALQRFLAEGGYYVLAAGDRVRRARNRTLQRLCRVHAQRRRVGRDLL